MTATATTDNSDLKNNERYLATRKVTLVGALVNLLLSIAQLFGGMVTHSHALIADGVHTLSDLASDFVVLVANRHAHQQADEGHPYGHGRIETLATSALGIILLIVAGSLIFDIVDRILSPEHLLNPTPAALLFGSLAVVAKEGLFRYTRKVARKVRSSLLEANAWHHRSDVVSSLMVIVGIGGNLMGIPYLDALAALAVALFVGRIGIKLLWSAGQELIDAALEPEVLERTETFIRDVDGVLDMHMLRTRKSGGDAFADVHIQVGPKVSVSEGHQIAEAVRHTIVDNIEEITDVTVHIDPEDDCVTKSCAHLPLRTRVHADIRQRWEGLANTDELEFGTMHYLDGEILLELIAPLSAAEQTESLQAIRERTLENPDIGEIRLLFRDNAP